MRLDRFDLNLLVAFHALMEARSVTRAAERLHLTQPAMSAALRRLRESFNDPLLVATGKQMIPTPHALELAPRVAEIVATTQALMAGSTLFDPETSRRSFRIAASDYVTSIAVQPLLTEMATRSPGIRCSVIAPHAGVTGEMERGDLDCIISPEQFQAQGHPAELLFEEDHVLLGWSENPLFARPITEADYQMAGHVVVELSNQPAFVEQHVRARGYTRRIEVTVTSFTLVPWLLPGTQRIALVHARLARLFMDKLPLAMAPPPFPLPKMREMIQFNRTRALDAGLIWFRDGLRRHAEN
ncbi:DNA-binding transcriptional regulator, LysR family [Sphingomonas sp. NFR04]|uniref:LysR family transcriptional regulator n=1 Tax=Sphingomonas sp. NFR04 TaxID=1566283 RepID=UPI0008EDD780|nr:LysR family transcriptional regulator [Sphingomonas sp. NFR04]SFJ53278.1 DNA-binding transcriptional regulator, LysR family [Sphingomonas sp. NFR04]